MEAGDGIEGGFAWFGTSGGDDGLLGGLRVVPSGEELAVETDDFFNLPVVVDDLLVVAAALVCSPGLNHFRHLLKNLVGLPGNLGLDLQNVFFQEPNVELLLLHAPLPALHSLALPLQRGPAGAGGAVGFVGAVGGGTEEVCKGSNLETGMAAFFTVLHVKVIIQLYR